MVAYPLLIIVGFMAINQLVSWARKRRAHPVAHLARSATAVQKAQ